MEKRWCQRVLVSLDVVIYHKGFKLGKCRVKNISLCGICLNSGPLAFHEGTELQIKFPDSAYLTGNLDTIKANVVRNSNSEIGLMFNPTEPELLKSVMKSSRHDIQRLYGSIRSL